MESVRPRGYQRDKSLSRNPPRYGRIDFLVPAEMHALVLEYSNETGKPIAWIGRKLFRDFLVEIGKLSNE